MPDFNGPSFPSSSEKSNPLRKFRGVYSFLREPTGTVGDNQYLKLNGFEFFQIDGATNPILRHAIIHQPSTGHFVVLKGQITQDSFQGIVHARLPEGDKDEQAENLINAFQTEIDRLYKDDPDVQDEEGVDPDAVRRKYLQAEIKTPSQDQVDDAIRLYIIPGQPKDLTRKPAPS